MFPVVLYLTPRAIASREATSRAGSSLEGPLLTSCYNLLFCCNSEIVRASSSLGESGEEENQYERCRATTSRVSADHRGDHLPSSRSSRSAAELHLAEARSCPGFSRAAPVS